ncbi:hypothetical protein X798_00237, partial [Onchocerca flexuosa]
MMQNKTKIRLVLCKILVDRKMPGVVTT